jgi:ribosomal protein S18 acetylase RimI-like enzyme
VDVLTDSGVIAALEGRPVGLATWHVGEDGTRAELRAVAVAPSHRRQGIGRALLDAAHSRLRAAEMRSVWLTSTNDNLGALALYEALGYRIVEVRHGAVDEARRTIKPSIAVLGEHGIPIRDELELALRL